MDCVGLVDFLVLGVVFVVEELELVVGCCEAGSVVCEWEGIFFALL